MCMLKTMCALCAQYYALTKLYVGRCRCVITI